MTKTTIRYSDGNEESCTGNLQFWQDSTILAAEDNNFFRHFRRSDAFMRVIEGSPKVSGIWNLRRLKKNAKFISALPLLQSSEWVGSPLNLIDFKIDAVNYFFNPTTIRYANNVCNYIDFFGDGVLSDMDIYEIGGGYGGECKVFNDFAMQVYSRDLRDHYHVFDLKSSYGLIQKFLSGFGYSTKFIELGSLDLLNNNGLVISNGAISEMRGKLLDEYIDVVVSPAKYGYFMTNFESHSLPYGGMTTAQFMSRLRDVGKTDVVELSSSQYLSHFDHQAGTRLIVFGAKVTESDSGTRFSDTVMIRLLQKLLRINERLTNYILN